ncbi:hypothetical protein B0E38_01832 [Streptomyces sp. 111WW2]|uniref:hypothetical protein n=1 Tax=Streptomyces sp. 111WW2 TaxID=1945515 RepID=UPI000D0C8F7D|nr:hypothetical protein [Streptomyces sp. 111WW2]PSK57987.1 hypothetical protein B0E38_01832 [Streptomyces sp. 111WW2]
MTGTTGSIALRGSGFAVLPAPVDLQPSASGVWVNSGLSVSLPTAGLYALDATVRAGLNAGVGTNTWIRAHLFDVTAGADVPDSEVLVHQLITTVGTGPVDGGHDSAPILVTYAVAGPRTVRLEAARHNSFGASTAAALATGPAGRTTLRWRRIG